MSNPESSRGEVQQQLSAVHAGTLVQGLLEAYDEMKKAYFEGRNRPSELEAGHFAEWAFRVCEEQCLGTHTPIGKSLPRIGRLTEQLASATGGHDSFKLHIPRVLAGIYDMRNRRGVGHPSGDVSPNRADAELLVTAASWVVAEMLRHAYSTDLETAQRLTDDLVKRRVPIVEEIDGFPRILRVGLPLRDRVLLVLLHYSTSVRRADIRRYARAGSGGYLTTTLRQLDQEALVHETASGWLLTSLGVQRAEEIIAAVEHA